MDVRLRLCRDIQPGTELLLYADSVGKVCSHVRGDSAGHTGESENTVSSCQSLSFMLYQEY